MSSFEMEHSADIDYLMGIGYSLKEAIRIIKERNKK